MSRKKLEKRICIKNTMVKMLDECSYVKFALRYGI